MLILRKHNADDFHSTNYSSRPTSMGTTRVYSIRLFCIPFFQPTQLSLSIFFSTAASQFSFSPHHICNPFLINALLIQGLANIGSENNCSKETIYTLSFLSLLGAHLFLVYSFIETDGSAHRIDGKPTTKPTHTSTILHTHKENHSSK